MVLFYQNIALFKNDTQEFLTILECFSSPLTSQFQYGRSDYSGALTVIFDIPSNHIIRKIVLWKS